MKESIVETEKWMRALLVLFTISFVFFTIVYWDWSPIIESVEQNIVGAESEADEEAEKNLVPLCETVVRTANDCGLKEVDENYTDRVCRVRPYRKLVFDQNHTHYENTSKTNCYTEFSVWVKNLEKFKDKFRVDFNIFDHDLEFIETLSVEHNLDWNQERKFEERYTYTCGKPRINTYTLQVIPPEKKFCSTEILTRKVKEYVCKDVNVEVEICR